MDGEYVERDLEQTLWEYMDAPEILAVVGPRQAGKTTLLEKINQDLENSRFVTFEDRDVLRVFEEDEKEFAELYLEDTDYLIIDEFQYAEEGGKKLKYLYDEYPDRKLLITGSSAADMTIQGLKHLTGRVLTFRLSPFSFREFLRYRDENLFQLFRKREEELRDWINGGEEPSITDTTMEKIEELRKEYAVYGGYPRVVLADTDDEKETVLDNIVETYLVREIGDVLGIEDDRRMEDLMRILALQMGEKTNYSAVSDRAEITYNRLKEWLSVLEHTFVLEQVRPFFTNKQKEIVKSPKIYFHDSGFRNSLLNNFQDLEMRKDQGELNENFFFTQAGAELKYWRTKSGAEMDFVIDRNPPVPFEVKTSARTTKSFRSFQEKYGPEKAFLMNETELGRENRTYRVPLAFAERTVE
ncbi:MAG: ATP-binding protein, partial [Candidatus Nanohaloarchaea archaeon]